MSCCNRRAQKIIVQCGETQEAETYTFSNANVTGQGVFISESSNAVTFKGIASSGGTITVTADAPNNTVNLEINAASIPSLVPQASETVQGKIELATAAEVITGTDTERAVTVAGLVGRTSTTLRSGLVRIATNAETLAGALTTVAVSPAGLTYYESFLRHPVTFANAGVRAAAVPAYVGQIGVQQDTFTPYIGTTLVAGDWEPAFFIIGNTMTLTSETTVDAFGGNLVITDTNAGQGGLSVEDTGYLHIDNGGTLNFHSDGRVAIDGSNVGTVRLIGTTATAGQITSYAISSFINATSTTADYVISNALDLRTYDADTVTTAQLADVVATLIADLNALKLPTLT